MIKECNAMIRLGVFGVSSSFSSLKCREEVAEALEKEFVLSKENQHDVLFVFLSTCQRAEIYFASESPEKKIGELFSFLENKLSPEVVKSCYGFVDADVFIHLALVTAGLESAFTGETEIQGQVKRAYLFYKERAYLGSALHELFQKSLKIAKNFRSDFKFHRPIYSLGAAIFDKIETFHFKSDRPSVVFIGYSKMNQSLIRLFDYKGYRDLTLVTGVSHEKICTVPSSLKIRSKSFLNEKISAEVIISATKDLGFLISRNSLAEGKKLLFDLSVPRTFDPLGFNQEGHSLLNIEDIQKEVSLHPSHCGLELMTYKEYLSAMAMQAFKRFEQRQVKTKNELLCPC